jgi:hypothetical protein
MSRSSSARQTREAGEIYPGSPPGGEVEGDPGADVEHILSQVDFLPPEDELPMVGFGDVQEDDAAAGDFTSLGFAKIHPGWTCVGYVLGVGTVESEFDSEAGKRKQRIFHVRGTVRAQLANSDSVADVRGTVKLPQYARLRESVQNVLRAERRDGHKICVKITYMGQAPDTLKDDGSKKRSGAHIWDVRRVKVRSAT